MGRKRKFVSDGDSKYLPPCRVCEGPAGGFHYGVNTCEACKGFFHRISKGNIYMDCQSGGQCPVYYTNPKICKQCRYEKCVSVGMAKKAIKTGRYTVQKRTQDTLEVKDLRQNGRSIPSATSEYSDYCDPHKRSSICVRLGDVQDLSLSSSSCSSPGYPEIWSPSKSVPDSNPSPGSPFENSSVTFGRSLSFHGDATSPSCELGLSELRSTRESCFSQTYIKKAVEQRDTTECCITQIYMEKDRVADIIYRAKESYIPYIPPYVSAEELKMKAAQHLEACRQQHKHGLSKGSKRSGDSERDYDGVYNAVEEECRLQAMSILIEKRMRALAKFAKHIPGFTDLDLADQINLIKFSRFEILYVCEYYKVDLDTGVVLCGDGEMRCKHEIPVVINTKRRRDGTKVLPSHTVMEERFDKYIRMWTAFQNLQLTPCEKAIFAAIVMCAPDRRDQLQSYDKVTAIYEGLVDCLIHQFKQRCSQPLQHFAKVINLMAHFRSYSHKLVAALTLTRFDEYFTNPFLREMVDFDESELEDGEDQNFQSLLIA